MIMVPQAPGRSVPVLVLSTQLNLYAEKEIFVRASRLPCPLPFDMNKGQRGGGGGGGAREKPKRGGKIESSMVHVQSLKLLGIYKRDMYVAL